MEFDASHTGDRGREALGGLPSVALPSGTNRRVQPPQIPEYWPDCGQSLLSGSQRPFSSALVLRVALRASKLTSISSRVHARTKNTRSTVHFPDAETPPLLHRTCPASDRMERKLVVVSFICFSTALGRRFGWGGSSLLVAYPRPAVKPWILFTSWIVGSPRLRFQGVKTEIGSW